MTLDSNNNPTRKHYWMIAYDIASHRNRRRVHEILKDHGQRVQFSVFECELSQQQLQSLRCRLSDLIEAGDSIRWYPLCRWCRDRIDWTGNGQPPQTDPFYLS